jgi:peptidoglycan/LPS O-acetylase OafA/YrhL
MSLSIGVWSIFSGAGSGRKRPRNNFDTLRILAALLVMVSHAWPLSGQQEPLVALSHHQATGGGLAVGVFFIISGYLITESFERSRNAWTFVVARALRLLPALAVTLMLLTFVIGPLLTVEPLGSYFTASDTYAFVLVNVSLISWVQPLPGVFLHNPVADQVNGSLWTLSYEARCYLAVLCLGVCGLLNRFVSLTLLAAGAIALKLWLGEEPLTFFTCFAAGAALHHWRPPLRGWLAAICFALCVASILVGGFRVAEVTVFAYLVIWLAQAPELRLPDLGRHGDLSYGTYIWAFPVQQTATLLLGSHACWQLNLLIAVPVTLALAFVSWHVIEAPALQLKERFRRRRMADVPVAALSTEPRG